MTPLVSQLWPQFMADPAFASCFGQVIVEHARMLRQSQQVIFTLRSAAPLDKGLCARLLASLQPDYEGFELKIENHFGYATLDETALRALLEEMKADGVPINGFLDRCSITILGQSITVGVRHGTKFLQEMGFEKLLADCIARHTGVTPKVSLISAVSEAEQHQMEEKLERKIAPPVVKFEKKNTAPSIKVEGLDLTDKPVTIFHGKMFTPKNLTPLKDLGGEGGKCTIWGDVFFTEVKGIYRKIYTVSITDYTGSINLKIRAQEGEDCSKWESIGKGTTVIVRGDCSYDKYEHDYIVYPYDVLFVERKKREDSAPVKRVELHLHTKLSSMDGFCDPGGIVRLAHRMGHPAIAITDHGVCQGYPEAMLAADDIHKKDPDFKLIYGCEAYFVDDMIPCVYGVQEQPLTGEFCVFDTETTGLDPGVEYMTEIGGVIVRNGEVMEEFDTFVKPGKPITPKITEITGITNEMVADAPSEKEALEAFLKFAGGRILVGHNVHSFDMRFLRAAAKRSGISLENVTYIDTLTMAQAMYPGLHNYKQGTINKHLELPAYEAHRACEDSAALGRIFCVMLKDLEEKQVTKVSEINTGLGGNREVLKKKYYHLIILVKNQMGLKNLYKIVSEAHVNYFFKKPRVPRSLLNKYRDGLLLTSACEAGELYRAIVDGTPYEELKKIARLLGRYREISAYKRKNSFAYGRGEKYDLTEGNDITNCLSSELALLGTAETEILFMRRYEQKRLMQHRKRAAVAKGRGDMIVLIDESGSTRSVAGWAKALALALLDIASKDRRKFAMVHFASADRIKTDLFEPGYYTPEDVIKAAEQFFGGGTNFEAPLKEALRLMECGYENADITIITDGECSLPEPFTEEFRKKAASYKATVTGILLDKGGPCGKSLEPFCDKIYHTSELTEDEIAVQLLNSKIS